MRSSQIESWALRIIDCVKKAQPNEDFLVELKRDWVEPDKAARRVAGHANAARGENILWLIGVDEKQGVIGVNFNDLASWYASVESCFNELSPRMIPLNIPVDELIIVALLFETDRAPFIVKNPVHGSKGGGAVELEIPWRENTSIRSARRSEIIRLLAPLEHLPEVEILCIDLKAIVAGHDSLGNSHFDCLSLNLEMYIIPKNKNRLVIPKHRCYVEFKISEIPIFKSAWIKLSPAKGDERSGDPGSLTIQGTSNELIIDAPGKFLLEASAPRPNLIEHKNSLDIHISIYLFPTSTDYPVVLTKTIPYPRLTLP